MFRQNIWPFPERYSIKDDYINGLSNEVWTGLCDHPLYFTSLKISTSLVETCRRSLCI